MATTEKPLPASPARAASMAALSARILVWSAIELMIVSTWPICWLRSPSARILFALCCVRDLDLLHRRERVGDRLLAGLGRAERRLGHGHDLVGVLGDLAVRARQLLHRRRGLADRRGLLGGAGGLLLGGREDVVGGLRQAVGGLLRLADEVDDQVDHLVVRGGEVADLVFGVDLDLVADLALAGRSNRIDDGRRAARASGA